MTKKKKMVKHKIYGNNVNTSRKKKRKRRLRIDRVLIVLIIFLAIIFGFKFASYISYNNKIYKQIIKSSENTVEIKKKYKKLKLYNKTIEYIKENKMKIIVKDKKYSILISHKNIKKKMDLSINAKNEKLTYTNFNKVKAFTISNVNKFDSITITLPRYLRKNEIVDIYGVKDNKVTDIKLAQVVKDNKVTFNTNDYDKYFITYIKTNKISVKEMTVNINDIINLDVKYSPENVTVKDFEYTNIGDIFMLKDNKLVAKKSGTDYIEIKHKKENIKEKVKITVNKEQTKIEKKDGLTYVDGILIVNKSYPVSEDYDPGSLNEQALNAFYEMRQAAAEDDITLWIQSGYRSYNTQKNLYNEYVSKDGKEKADTYSARPGYSEHQTGYAMDLNIIDSSFEGTPEAIWIAKNCYKYGFIIRYPKGKENITGYKYEPWHIRYLGKDLAKKVYDSGLTLEEYLGIDSKYSE